MQINVTPLIPVSVGGKAVAAAVQGLYLNCNNLTDYDKDIATDRDKISIQFAGAQANEVLEILVNTAGANTALDEVSNVLVNVPFARFTTKSKDGRVRTGERLLGNIAYILDRTTADNEADVVCLRWVAGGSRLVAEHWIVDTSAEAVVTRLARTDAGSGAIS